MMMMMMMYVCKTSLINFMNNVGNVRDNDIDDLEDHIYIQMFQRNRKTT